MRKKRGLVVCLLLVLCGAFFPKAPDMPGDVLGAVPDGVESSGEIRGAGGGEVIPADGISGIGTGTYTVTAEPGAPGDPSSAGLRFLVSEEPETPVYCCNMGRPYAEQGEDTAEGLVKIPDADDGETAQNFVRLAFREPEKVPLEDSPRASEPELPRASEPELPGTGGDLPLRNDRPGRPSSGRSSHPRPIFRVDVPANAGNTVPVSREVKPAAMGAPVSTAPELSRKEETAENPAARPVRTGEDFPGRFWQGAFAASGLCLAGWCLRQRRRRTR